MKNTIRCCISCILPCGTLDVIRIVHSNGSIEELSKTVRAGEIMKANPKHVVRKLSTLSSQEEGDIPRIVILPPEAELKRGKIYFLVPLSSLPEKTRSKREAEISNKRKSNSSSSEISNNSSSVEAQKLLTSDQHLSEILSEKKSVRRDRRQGRVGIWRPHLESISEISNDL